MPRDFCLLYSDLLRVLINLSLHKVVLKYFVINHLICFSLIYILLILKGILSGQQCITFYFNDISNFTSCSYELDIFSPHALCSFLEKRSQWSSMTGPSDSLRVSLCYTYISFSQKSATLSFTKLNRILPILQPA